MAEGLSRRFFCSEEARKALGPVALAHCVGHLAAGIHLASKPRKLNVVETIACDFRYVDADADDHPAHLRGRGKFCPRPAEKQTPRDGVADTDRADQYRRRRILRPSRHLPRGTVSRKRARRTLARRSTQLAQREPRAALRVNAQHEGTARASRRRRRPLGDYGLRPLQDLASVRLRRRRRSARRSP